MHLTGKYMVELKYPLIDLHRHLEGSLRPQTILELGGRYGIHLASDLKGICELEQVSEPQPDLVT